MCVDFFRFKKVSDRVNDNIFYVKFWCGIINGFYKIVCIFMDVKIFCYVKYIDVFFYFRFIDVYCICMK